MKSKYKKSHKNYNDYSNKRSFKAMTIFFAIIVACLIFFAVFFFYFNIATSTTINENTYQYLGDGRSDYSSGIRIKSSNMSNLLYEGDDLHGLDSTPLYSLDSSSIFLSKDYYYFSIDDFYSWSIPEFSKIASDKNVSTMKCFIGKNTYEFANGFITDGGSNFIFLDSGKIIINDFSEYQVTPLSFFSKEYDILRIYDYVNDKYVSLNTTSNRVIYISNLGYSLDMISGIYTDSKGKQVLLGSSPRIFDSLEERYK